jgi:hypothetical protein
MIYEALFYSTRLALALHHYHDGPAGLHEDLLKLGEGIYGKATKEGLDLVLLAYKMLRQG